MFNANLYIRDEIQIPQDPIIYLVQFFIFCQIIQENIDKLKQDFKKG